MSECNRCGDTGWLPCEELRICVEPSHGTYCKCPAGIERAQEDSIHLDGPPPPPPAFQREPDPTIAGRRRRTAAGPEYWQDDADA